MKNKILAIAAICGTALSPVLTTAAMATATAVPVAAGADASTLATMTSQCNALAAAQPTEAGAIPGTTTDGRTYSVTWNTTWSAETVAGGSSLVSGPTETGPRNIDLTSVVGTGSFTWGGIKIVGDPFRNGGSVNMFGNQRATEQNFSSSTYNYTANFNSTFAYASSCVLTQTTHYAAVHLDGTPDIPGHPVEGYYTNSGTHPSGGQGSCQGVNPNTSFWGFDSPNGECVWHKTADAVDPVEGLDPFDLAAHDDVTNTVAMDGALVNQDQTDNLSGHEANGGPVTLAGDLFVGNPVVCISPKKLPGIWTKQNGYTGDKCTTAWFTNPSIAWNASTTSQGTYISVPAY